MFACIHVSDNNIEHLKMVKKEKNTVGEGTWMKLDIIGLVQLRPATNRFAEEIHCSSPRLGTLAWSVA